MNRRRFAFNLAASTALAATHSYALPPANITLEVDRDSTGPTMPLDFTGLSYESAQLANPRFFSATNQELIEIFRALTPNGVLRIGGGSSNFTTYSDDAPTATPPFEVFGPDTSSTVKSGTVTTALALQNLRAFLDHTQWSCIYGLNLGQGTKEIAAREATAAHRILGPRLVALQIGNEPDSFRNRYRPASYGPADFMREWNDFHSAIIANVPQAKFAGPDISNKQPFFEAFAAEAPQHPDVILLTAHAYAMGPARSPNATLEKLLIPDKHAQTQPESKLDAILAASAAAHLPYRMCEGNSCWDGGKPGVSDTLASALWAADYMLHLAQRGVVGVNLHGGGNGFYTPIAGAPSTGFTRRPEYFGMQFAQRFAGSTFLRATLANNSATITACAAKHASHVQLAFFNKSDAPTSIALPASLQHSKRAHQTTLTGPSFDSKLTTLSSAETISLTSSVNIPAHTALLLEVEAR
ncbi:MAG: hypothetical protein V4555_08695 [Acidobacteriota bacterium]